MQAEVTFQADDVIEIAGCVCEISARVENEFAEAGEGFARMLGELGDHMVKVWWARECGADEPLDLEVSARGLQGDRREVLEENLARLESLAADVADDPPWCAVLETVAEAVRSELKKRNEYSH
jgi:hypothetical protein